MVILIITDFGGFFYFFHRTHVNKLEFVTFGGGFGIPYINSEKHLKISDITNNEILQEKIHLLRSRNIKCNLELGRYLVAESGVFCATVEDIKISSEKNM